MKKFIAQNWYKLMIGTSLLMASFGFMIRSVTPAVAQATKGATTIKLFPRFRRHYYR